MGCEGGSEGSPRREGCGGAGGAGASSLRDGREEASSSAWDGLLLTTGVRGVSALSLTATVLLPLRVVTMVTRGSEGAP